MILMTLALWLLRRRRRKSARAKDVTNHQQQKLELEVPNHGHGNAELEVDGPSRMMADGNPRHEMLGRGRPQEAGSASINELQSHGIYHAVNH